MLKFDMSYAQGYEVHNICHTQIHILKYTRTQISSYNIYKIIVVCVCMRPSRKMFTLPGNGLNFEASLLLSRLEATNGVLLKAFSHLLDYRHKKVSDKLYKRAVRTWGAYMSQHVHVERA